MDFSRPLTLALLLITGACSSNPDSQPPHTDGSPADPVDAGDVQLPDASPPDGAPDSYVSPDADSDAPSDATPDSPHPQPPKKCTVQSDAIVMQCEDLSGSWFLSTNVPGYLDRGYVVARADGVASSAMQGSLEIPDAGTYFVWARGYEYGADRRWQIEIDGTLLAETHADESEGFSWQLAGQIVLPAGPVSVRVLDVGEGWEVADAMALSTDPDFQPNEGEACWRVLDPVAASAMVFEEIMGRTRAYDLALPVPQTVAAWEQRAASLRGRLSSSLGLDGTLEQPPSNLQHLGQTQLEGYRIERLTFEAIDGFTVTANVYVPDGTGPFPAVVSPLGHWNVGKAHPTPAARSHALALLGYVSITFDLFGYGERRVPGNEHDVHWPLVLTGRSNAGVQVQETSQALSYLLTRGDVDPSRIGLTGASGGGLATLYTSTVDTRFHAAVPVAYVTQFEELLESGIRRCGCSHVPSVASFTNMGEMLGLFGPKPLTLLAGVNDPIFPVLGTMKAEAQARTPYELYGAGDQLALRIFDAGHDYDHPMREAMYGMFEEVLGESGDGSPVPEPSFDVPPDSVYHCFPTGKVPSSSPTLRSLARDWAEQASSELPVPSHWEPDDMRSNLSSLLNPPAPQAVGIEVLGTAETDGMPVELMRLEVQPGILLPGRMVRGDADSPVVLIAEEDRTAFPGAGTLRVAHDLGWTALHTAPRGLGETAWAEYQTVSNNVLLGDSLAGQRAFDLSQVGRALENMLQLAPGNVDMLALGPESALSALFAQALWGEFHAVALGPLPSTVHRAFLRDLPTMGYVASILHVADIPHVAGLAADRPLLLGFGDDSFASHYPEWSSFLAIQADQVEILDVASGLTWLSSVRASEVDDS